MTSLFSKNIIVLDSVDSTNNYAFHLIEKSNIKEGTVIITGSQTKGKGQRGKIWESTHSKNILLSLILEPNIEIIRQFQINIFISLAVYDFLCFYLGPSIKIKWPNDFIIDEKKVAGILIENKIFEGKIKHSIIGIGININQNIFEEYIPPATSFFIEIKKIFNIDSLIKELLCYIESRYSQFRDNQIVIQSDEYVHYLYLKDEYKSFYVSGRKIIAKVFGVSDRGKIVLKLKNGCIEEFNIGELRVSF